MKRGKATGRQVLSGARRPLRMEALEHRRLLAAAGLLQLSTTVPISQSGQPNIEGTALIGADIVLLDPSDPAALSITETTAVGSGTIDGKINVGGFLLDIDGTFQTDPKPPTVQVTPLTGSQLQIQAQQTGTFNAVIQFAGQQSGTFTTSIDGVLDLESRTLSGTIQLDLQGEDGFQSRETFPFTQTDTLPAGIEIPDPTKASVADRVFHDLDADGLQDGGEPGVASVRVQLIRRDGGTDVIMATTNTDAAGFYSFYNVEAGDYAVQFDQLPAQFDITKSQAGNHRSTDSDPSSLTGRTQLLTLVDGMHRRDVDAGLRTVDHEWQNPNQAADVDDDGTVQALDALKIINRLNRRDDTGTLPQDRPLGSMFYDTDGSGTVTAADALRVINFLNRRPASGEGEAAPPDAAAVDLLLPGILQEQEQRRRRGV